MAGRFLLTLFILSFHITTHGQSIQVIMEQADPRVLFATGQIKKAALQKKWTVESIPSKSSTAIYSITIITDSTSAQNIIRVNNFSPAGSFGEQCYSIRIKRVANKKSIYVLAGEGIGAMYGALDIAEAIECNRMDSLNESNNTPYLANRGIKFNIPLDLRTPTYSDPGDANQLNIPNSWDLGFWQHYFDQMAIHRYNVMTLWSLQPFPSMVKIPEYPETALNDVWRTKEKYDDTYSSTGVGFDRPILFKNVEIVKKITIEQKIEFWRKVMQMAADRGISFYVFTWNIFTYSLDGKYGITHDQNNQNTIAWYRAAIREMTRTYPLLRGIGITAGEGMDGKRKDEFSNEKWLWKTYGEGIRDGLKDQPNRKFTLVHRFHWASLNEIQKEFSELPCRLELSLKYAIAHMYSIPNPPFILPAMPLLSKQTRSWLTLRNDDIYSFRWGNIDFARKFINAIPEIEKIAGFYMGPDGYCWGKDYLSKLNAKNPQFIIDKQWYSFMLWGRLSYDPGIPAEIFNDHLWTRYGNINRKEFLKGWESASMIFPWITRFVWGDIDLKWFPEANLSHPNHKGFYTVKDYIEREPMEGSNIIGILPWLAVKAKGEATDHISPLDVADSLDAFANSAILAIKFLPAFKDNSTAELQQVTSDMVCMGWIGKYYANKIRAAVDLARFDATSDISFQRSAINYLETAKTYWNDYARVYSIKNKAALYNRVGYVDVNKLKVNVQKDIDMVKNWKPGVIKLKVNGTTEQPFKN